MHATCISVHDEHQKYGVCRYRCLFMCVCVYLWVPSAGAEDVGKKDPPLERTSSISEEYMRYLNNPENEEKRFPVDRKKLERLIVGESMRGHVTCSQGRLMAVCYIKSTYQ